MSKWAPSVPVYLFGEYARNEQRTKLVGFQLHMGLSILTSCIGSWWLWCLSWWWWYRVQPIRWSNEFIIIVIAIRCFPIFVGSVRRSIANIHVVKIIFQFVEWIIWIAWYRWWWPVCDRATLEAHRNAIYIAGQCETIGCRFCLWT